MVWIVNDKYAFNQITHINYVYCKLMSEICNYKLLPLPSYFTVSQNINHIISKKKTYNLKAIYKQIQLSYYPKTYLYNQITLESIIY